MKKLFAIVLAVLSIAACKKDDTIMYQYTAFGDVSGNTIFTDNGVKFNITKVDGADGYNAHERIVFQCNVLKEISKTEYNIELLAWTRVSKKDCIMSGEITDDDALGHDPIRLDNAWVAGNYLNMEIAVTFLRNSETKHIVNLVLDQDASDDETLCFVLRHNGNGESVGPGSSLTFNDVALGRAYFSFPVTDLLPSGVSKNIKISWEWHKTDEKGELSTETEVNTTTGTV